MTFDEVCMELDSRSEAEIAAGGENFMGRPGRWYDEGPRWRCPNDHVSARYLKSEKLGNVCLECFGPLALTFPEDADGPLKAKAGETA